MNISSHLQQLNEKVKKSDMCLFVKSADLILRPCIWSLTFPLRNPSVVVTRVRHDESTSHLVRHADKCTPGATTATASIATIFPIFSFIIYSLNYFPDIFSILLFKAYYLEVTDIFLHFSH